MSYLSISIWKQLLGEKMPAEQVAFLILKFLGEDIPKDELTEEIESILISKNLLENDGRLSESGLTFLSSYLPRTTSFSSTFETFWKAYPSSDKWGRFKETRKIRTGKTETRELYDSIVADDPSLERVILEALENEVTQRKKESITQNSIKFMKSPYN